MSQTAVIAKASQPTNSELDTSRWAVVIPSFNHADDVINCLASLRDAERRPEHVILVDDASTEDAVNTTAAWAAKTGVTHEVVDPGELGTRGGEHVWLTIVAAKVNSGFSVSCNIGLRYVRDHTTAPFALLLNNDAAVSVSYFTDLAAGIANVPNVGLATGTIYEGDQRTVWYAGGRLIPLRAAADLFLEVPKEGSPRATEF